ncbi:MAG: hypothetical protein VR67_11740 [Peptococcaceae bacterium BRH_c8a]|nr:MAG: hypothetical protein VR67_11740 [Peptococcaceae bacterium BRH_c8a]
MISDDNKKKTTSQLDIELNQLISKAISSNEVVDILGSVGLSKPNIAERLDTRLYGIKQGDVSMPFSII